MQSERVYPRMRGGTVKPYHQPHLGAGLSPHARGNPNSDQIVIPHHGSIPACAGEP